jgi:hypothetical protein
LDNQLTCQVYKLPFSLKLPKNVEKSNNTIDLHTTQTVTAKSVYFFHLIHAHHRSKCLENFSSFLLAFREHFGEKIEAYFFEKRNRKISYLPGFEFDCFEMFDKAGLETICIVTFVDDF